MSISINLLPPAHVDGSPTTTVLVSVTLTAKQLSLLAAELDALSAGEGKPSEKATVLLDGVASAFRYDPLYVEGETAPEPPKAAPAKLSVGKSATKMSTLGAALLLLVGCASYPPGSEQDYADCDFQARMATASNPSAASAGYNMVQLRNLCMQRRGWSLSLRQ